MKEILTRDYRLDFVRFFAAMLVMYAHLINSATFASNIYGFDLYFNNISYPILDSNSHFLLNFDILLGQIKINSGVLGVILFFLVSGYLMYDIQRRYSPLELLINRFFRIYPAAIFSCIIVLIISYLYGGKGFSFKQIITSLTLTQDYFQQAPMIGIFWTLLIELKFYVISALMIKWTEKKILFMSFAIFLVTYTRFSYGYCGPFFELLTYDSVFFIFFLLGLLFRIHNSIVFIVVFLIGCLAFSFYPVDMYSGYSMFLTLLLFYFFVNADIFNMLGKILKRFADTTYSLYLLHLPVGGAIYYSLEGKNLSIAFKILITCSVVFVCSYIHYLLIEKSGIAVGSKIIKYLRKS